MRRVLSGCSSKLNFPNRSRRSLRNRFASPRCWNPTTKSSANLVTTMSPRACLRLQDRPQRSKT
jgi:hypothetical protein